MTAKYQNTFALVHFFEEKKFSVMKLKDCIPQMDNDLNAWNPKQTIEVLWDNGSPYPANILQFGENKKSMDKLIDDLINGAINTSDIPLLQDSSKRGRGIESSSLKSKHDKVPRKRKRDESGDFFKIVRKNINLGKEKDCEKCLDLTLKLKEKNKEIDNLKSQLQDKEFFLQERKEKYIEMKRKHKEKKRQLKEHTKEANKEEIKFGFKTVPIEKLSLCRTDYSKYVGDLLDICFGRETLCDSILKCTKNRTSKTNVLDEKTINDIASHVIDKYKPSVGIGMVRAAIRQKLNTCHKSKQRNKT